MTTTRHTITIPANGAFQIVEAAGVAIIVESGAITAPADVPTLHLDSQNADGLPAYPQAKFETPFERFYVRGTTASAGGTLYLLVQNTPGLRIAMPNTPVHA